MLDVALGALGALLTIYARSQVLIPTFRALWDISAKEKMLERVYKDIENTQKDIDKNQEDYRDGKINQAVFKDLDASYRGELESQEKRRRKLDAEIQNAQIFHRGLGFIAYIVFGGIFGAYLSDLVNIEGLSGKFAEIFKPFIMGATWTTYLSVLGFSQVKNEARDSAKEELEKVVPAITEKTIDKIRAELAKKPQAVPEDALVVAEVQKNIAAQIDLSKFRIDSRLKSL